MIDWVAERREQAIRTGWRVIADQVDPFGYFPWDVYVVHDCGARVPPGPNRHAQPAGEMDRLHRLIECTQASCSLGCPAFPKPKA